MPVLSAHAPAIVVARSELPGGVARAGSSTGIQVQQAASAGNPLRWWAVGLLVLVLNVVCAGLPAAAADPFVQPGTADAVQSTLVERFSIWVLQTQRELHRTLTRTLHRLDEAPAARTAAALILASFLYGVFHAAGPGHGKAVITTFLLTHRQSLRRGLLLSLAAALLQGVTAILAVLILIGMLGFLAREAIGQVRTLELASFLLVALLGLWLVWRGLRSLWRIHRDARGNTAGGRAAPIMPAAPPVAPAAVFQRVGIERPRSLSDLGARSEPGGRARAVFHDFEAHSGPMQREIREKCTAIPTGVVGAAQVRQAPGPLAPVARSARTTPHAALPGDCGCGAPHHVDPNLRGPWYATVVAVGIRPCSGAVLVMAVSYLLGLWLAGIAAVLAMSLGTAITVSALAILAVTARDLAQRLARPAGLLGLRYAGALAGIAGGLMIFLVGGLLAQGSLAITPAPHPLGL